jgi:hypothetical protein
VNQLKRKMENFKLILSCQLCNQLLKGTPINLSCCDATICSEHVQYRTVKVNESKTIQVFECELCQCSQNMRYKRFAVNKSVEKLLQLKFEQIYLGEVYENVNKEILNLGSSLKKISDMMQDPRNFIYEHVSELRRKVDLRREKIKEKIDNICDKMIKKLDDFQKDCYDNIPDKSLEESNRDLINDVQSKLDEWNANNKHLLLLSKDAKRKEIELKSIELDIKLHERIKEMESKLLMDQTWIHLEDNTFIEELDKELIKFEG